MVTFSFIISRLEKDKFQKECFFFVIKIGMNVIERILSQHVEYESQAYMYAFTIEIEISAASMWCFVNHLKSNVSELEKKNEIFCYSVF